MSPDLAVMTKVSHAERRLEALMALNQGQENFQDMNWARAPRGTGDTVLDMGRLSVSDEQPPNAALYPSAAASRGLEYASVSPKNSVSYDGDLPNGTGIAGLMSKAPSIDPQVSLLYSQASSLLLNAMDADGVLILGAPRGNSRHNSRRSSCAAIGGLDGTTRTAETRRRSSSLSSAIDWDERLCDQFSSTFKDGIRHKAKTYALTQGLLQQLIELCPHGDIFDSFPHPKTSNMDRHEFAHTLGQVFPKAKSLIFLPLWDWDKSRWASGLIVWAYQHQFTDYDLRYMRTYGQAIVSRLVQLDRKATGKSKDDLLASLSHELRSPLHGMLANAELVQSTSLDTSQRDMMKMIQTCGSTLLDTMNHLLDFAKINNLSNAHNVSADNAAQIEGLATQFNLDDLIEDVTESLYAGCQSPNRLSDSSCCSQKRGDVVEHTHHSSSIENLSVVIRIAQRHSWKVRSFPGAWRRIVMNIVGNALKFTQTGLVEICLDWESEPHRNSKSGNVCIVVTDTGCGISQDYIQEKLFTPFSQEHILTEGVGLGLSIARQLSSNLGGSLDIKSEVGVGTQATILIPVELTEQERTIDGLTSKNEGIGFPKRLCFVGLDSRIEAVESSEAKRKLAIRDAVQCAIQRQGGLDLSSANKLSDGCGDVAVLEQSTLHELASRGPVQSVFPSIIVLGAHRSSNPTSISFEGSINVVTVSQPLGPRKILQALQTLDNPQKSATPWGRDRHPILSDSIKSGSLSVAFATHYAVNSPPVARDSVSEYTASLPKSPEERYHVLIVDDNIINLKVLSTFMDKIGCTYDTATNGLIAFEKYRDSPQRFDFVLMDISMPVMDGVTATSKIREYEGDSSMQPSSIMAVTGVGSSEMQEQAFAAGIDDYLVKPLSLQDLKRIMGVP